MQVRRGSLCRVNVRVRDGRGDICVQGAAAAGAMPLLQGL